MGRSSGYIAAYSTIANGSVDLCLVPELPVELSGPGSVLSHLEEVVARKGYAVAVVAEGEFATRGEKSMFYVHD